jgi:hypothetical protein
MQTLTASYVREADAKVAREWLVSHGVHPNRVSFIARATTTGKPSSGKHHSPGLWANIKAPAGSGETFLLTASVAHDKLEGAIAILSRKGQVTLPDYSGDERSPANAITCEPRSESAPSSEFKVGGAPKRIHLEEHLRLRLYEDEGSRKAKLDNAFTERAVELPETSEEVDFQTGFRIREYVVVQKVTRQRTQTISTSLRRAEAEVERLR